MNGYVSIKIPHLDLAHEKFRHKRKAIQLYNLRNWLHEKVIVTL